MNNLGLYAKITQWSKKCGGPANFLILVAASGYAIFRTGEAGIKWSWKKIKEKIDKYKKAIENPIDQNIYTFLTDYSNEYDLTINKGEPFQVLGIDDDVALISFPKKEDEPYAISLVDLLKISNYSNNSK